MQQHAESPLETPDPGGPARAGAAPVRPSRVPLTRTPLVEEIASFGERIAVVADGLAITYRELSERVDLRAAELGDGRRLVMIAGGNHVEILVTYLAALRGGHVVWLAPDAGPDGEPLIAAYRPDVIVRAADAGASIESRRDGSGHVLHPELALLLGTSGSTGAPRLVRLSHENLQANAEAIAEYLRITDSERALTSLPLHYCYGLSVVNSHLLCGARLLLTDRSVADAEFWALLREGGGTSFAGVPHTFDLLDRIGFEDLDLPTLRYVTQAGGRLAPESVRRFADLGARRGWRFFVMYGQTEATARIAYLPPELAAAAPGAIGVPIPRGSIEIRPVPEADGPGVGELVYRGPNVMLGYADSPDDLSAGRAVDELCTGDLGRRTPEGLIEITGRRGRFVKLFGLRIDLGQAERILEAAGVNAVCVGTDDLLVAATTDGARDPRRVAALLAERIGIPSGVVVVRRYESLPLLPSGKPDYGTILRDGAVGAGHENPALAAGMAGSAVADAFARVLDLERVRETDTFAGLGGDSLSYVEMSIALEEALGRLPAGWPEMTVGELTRLEERRAESPRVTARMETNVVLRAVAIVLVVAGHMTALMPLGGAHLLLAVAGYNFARFQMAAVEAPRRLARSLTTIARIALPASSWIALQVVIAGGFSLGAVLLVNNYTGAPQHTDGRWWYWYIEALVQILVVLTVLLAIPLVRRAHRARPFLFAIGLLVPALVLRFELVTLGEDHNRIYQPHTVVWFFLIGWAAQKATSVGRRAVVSALALASVPGFFDQAPREAVIVGGLLALLWVPALAVPRHASRLIGVVAAASLYIYLTHWQAWPALSHVLPAAPAVAATVAAGVGAWLLVERLAPAALRLARRGTTGAAARRPGGDRRIAIE